MGLTLVWNWLKVALHSSTRRLRSGGFDLLLKAYAEYLTGNMSRVRIEKGLINQTELVSLRNGLEVNAAVWSLLFLMYSIYLKSQECAMVILLVDGHCSCGESESRSGITPKVLWAKEEWRNNSGTLLPPFRTKKWPTIIVS